MRRRPGRSLTRTIEVVDAVQRQLWSLRGGAPRVTGYRFDYVAWIAEAEQALSEVFFRSDVTSLLHTPRFWDIWRTSDPPQDFPRLFFSEVEAQHAILQELLDEMKGVRDRLVGRPGAIIVPDANVFLHHVFFKEAAWTELTDGESMRMVVPLLVIEQLDRNKTSRQDHVARRAQQVIRALEDMLPSSGGLAEVPGRGTIEVLVDEPGHVRCAVEDEEIVETCRYLADVTGQPARLATGDLGMRLRASQLGVEVRRVPETWRIRN